MDEATYEQFGLPHAEVADELAVHAPVGTVQMLAVNGKPSGVQLPASVELAVSDTEPGVKGDTVSNVTKAGDSRDGRRRPGAAVRQRGRPDQGRPARGALHQPRLATPAPGASPAPDRHRAIQSIVSRRAAARRHDDPAALAGAARRQGADGRAAARRRHPRRAGFACLEVSGGGVFDAAVRRGVESPWERIRALAARTQTPLGIALRGRFLVGSKPVGADIVRAVRLLRGRERHRRLPPARPAQRRLQPARGGRGDRRRGQGVPRRASSTAPAAPARPTRSSSRRERCPSSGAARVILNDPTGVLVPHLAGELVERIARRAACPSASTSRARRAPASRPRSRPRRRAPTSSPPPSTRSR